MTAESRDPLPWPAEAARPAAGDGPAFAEPGSNVVLDFHGDPRAAGLVVFSDGNHHMALAECAALFLADNPDAVDVFYATTPPGPLVRALAEGGLRVGNLALSVRPDVFIGPEDVLDRVVEAGAMDGHRAFAESRGNVLLVPAGNPKGIAGVADLMREDVTIAVSNPETEAASFGVYADTLRALAAEADLDGDALAARLEAGGPRVRHSAAIHHREVPEMLARGEADVGVVYYHLGLRYSRVFPDRLDFVPLGGTRDDPRPGPGHPITRYHIGLVGDGGRWGGEWGAPFRDFMTGATAAAVYAGHGLAAPSKS